MKDIMKIKTSILALARGLNLVAGVAILAMMALTCADVIMRYFRRPIVGTYELVAFLSVIAVAFALAQTCVDNSHVAVSVLIRLFPAKIQHVIAACTAGLGIALFALLAWQSVLYGFECRASGEVSATLQLQFYPVIWSVAVGAGAVCLVLALDLFDAISKVQTR